MWSACFDDATCVFAGCTVGVLLMVLAARAMFQVEASMTSPVFQSLGETREAIFTAVINTVCKRQAVFPSDVSRMTTPLAQVVVATGHRVEDADTVSSSTLALKLIALAVQCS